jgi:hypothetical protein
MPFISLDLLTNALATKWASPDDLVLLGIRRSWSGTLPESITSHAYPHSLASGILTVAVDSPVRQREFGFLAGEIRAKLSEAIPKVSGLEIRFRTLRTFKLPRPKNHPDAIPEERMKILEQKARGIASSLPDPKQREAAFRFVLSCLEEGAILGYPESDPDPSKKRPDA